MKKPSGPQGEGPAQSVVDVAAIDRLARIVTDYDLSEVEISLGELRVRLARRPAQAVQTIAAPASARTRRPRRPPNPAPTRSRAR